MEQQRERHAHAQQQQRARVEAAAARAAESNSFFANHMQATQVSRDKRQLGHAHHQQALGQQLAMLTSTSSYGLQQAQQATRTRIQQEHDDVQTRDESATARLAEIWN